MSLIGAQSVRGMGGDSAHLGGVGGDSAHLGRVGGESTRAEGTVGLCPQIVQGDREPPAATPGGRRRLADHRLPPARDPAARGPAPAPAPQSRVLLPGTPRCLAENLSDPGSDPHSRCDVPGVRPACCPPPSWGVPPSKPGGATRFLRGPSWLHCADSGPPGACTVHHPKSSEERQGLSHSR